MQVFCGTTEKSSRLTLPIYIFLSAKVGTVPKAVVLQRTLKSLLASTLDAFESVVPSFPHKAYIRGTTRAWIHVQYKTAGPSL